MMPISWTSKHFDGESVAKFMEGLQERKGQPEENKVLRGQDPVGDILSEFGPVNSGQEDPRAHHRQPEEGSKPAEEGGGKEPEAD
jgi:hypothetical protein